MIGIHVTVPVACFRVGYAREFWESHPLPPPATCYGFLLSLVGEWDRNRHVGVRISAALFDAPPDSIVLRTLWRVKSRDQQLGVGENKTPGFHQLLTGVELVVWLDSRQEQGGPTLESRVAEALGPASRGRIERSGGLSLGESTHLVDEVSPLDSRRQESLISRFPRGEQRRILRCNAPQGTLSLPRWVDHVGSLGTRYTQADLQPHYDLREPSPGWLAVISPD